MYTLHIISRGQILVRLKVFVEVEKVAAVVGRVCNSDEAVYRRGSVRADDEVELSVTDGRRCGRGGRVAVVTEGGDAAEVAEPDHDFVGLGTGAGGTDEGVVGDVGADSGAGIAVNHVSRRLGVYGPRQDVPPRPCRWYGLNCTDLLARRR